MPLGNAFSSGVQAGAGVVTNIFDLKQRGAALDQEKQTKFIQQYNTNLTTATSEFDKAIKGIYATSQNPQEDIQKLREASKPIIGGLMRTGEMLGQDTRITQQMFDNVFAQPSPEQLAEAEAKKQGAITEAKTKATGKTRNFVLGDKIYNVDATDKEGIENLRNQGAFEIGLGVQATSLSDITPKQVSDAGDAISDVQSGAAAIKALRDVPGAVGVPGMITENVGGFLGSIGLSGAERLVSNAISGNDPEKVKAARSKFITFQGSMARAILNDTRISDYERRILNEAIGATGPTASANQLIGSYKQILAASTTLARRKQAEAGQQVLDLSTDEGINSLGKQLVNAGLTNEDAIDVIKQILDIEAIQGL